MKVCQYNWHSAGSLGWPFPMQKYKYIFQIIYTGAILSNSIWNCYGLNYQNADGSLKNKFV